MARICHHCRAVAWVLLFIATGIGTPVVVVVVVLITATAAVACVVSGLVFQGVN